MKTSGLTVNEVAARYRVDRSTVHRWIERGVINCILLPRGGTRLMIRFSLDQILRFEADHLVVAAGRTIDSNGIATGILLLLPSEVASMYAVHLSTVLRWCERGQISHFNLTLRTGGKKTVRFLPEHLCFHNETTVFPPTQRVASSPNNSLYRGQDIL